jgi:FkbM family methyltransferase
LTEWFESHVVVGETWLDVGGHYGYTAIALSRLVGPDGHVFAFEPVIGTAGCLARTRELNRLTQLTVVPLALIADSKLRAMDVPATRGMADSTLIHAGETERIFGIALESIWPAIGGTENPIHGIKIDVQGLEFQVLLGMREQLTRWSPKLVIEFHHGVDRHEILDLLISCGYSAQFEPVGGASPGILADDASYVFIPEPRTCAYSSIRSITARR